MNKIIFFVLFVSTFLFATDKKGFIRFENDNEWTIQLNDSLTLNANSTYALNAGIYNFKARPLFSYSWPTILIEDSLEIFQSDTTIYVLRTENSVARNVGLKTALINKPLVYSEGKYIPSYEKHSALKTSLILTALATNWLSFYLKRQADENYDKYRSASNLHKINDFYDKSQKFDAVTSVMLGVSAAALSTYIYLTLSED